MSILEIHEFHEWGQVVLCTLNMNTKEKYLWCGTLKDKEFSSHAFYILSDMNTVEQEIGP